MNALTGSSWLWSCLWQSTLFLGMGGLLSLLLDRRPARAHRVLLLAMAACLVGPLMSQAVHRLGWGLLGFRPVAYSAALAPSAPIRPSPVVPASPAPTIAPALEPQAPSVSSPANATNVAPESQNPHIPLSWPTLLVGSWAVLSVLALLRLVVLLLREVVLVRRAAPLQDETMLRTLDRALSHLNLRVHPALRVSSRISSPVICCWGTQPTLVVPQIRPSGDTPKAWFGILCHELAHWKRKDHWAFLVSELLACWLPWHPLVWWTGRRLNQLSELACDNWVLACGQPAQLYAESLLGLLPQRRAACTLPAVSLRTKLERRIHNIMADRPPSPLPGWKWAWSSLAIAVAIVAVVAFAQSTPTSETVASKLADGQVDYTPSGMTLRLVAKGYGSDFTSCPSRDGRYICFPNDGKDGGGWSVRDQTTGQERMLVKDPSGWSDTSVISPDCKYLIYDWGYPGTPGINTTTELRVVGWEGGASHVVYKNPTATLVRAVQWTEDSRAALALVEMPEDYQAVLVDVPTASSRLLRSFGKRWPSLAMSPDARYLAYDRRQENGPASRDVFVWDSREEREVPLVTHSAQDRLVAWSPDGRWILFTSDRSGTEDLWMVPVENGRGVDSPKLVQRGVGDIQAKGFLADGSLYYWREYRLSDVYTAPVDFEKGEFTEPPCPVPFSGLKVASEWSHDGRWLAIGNLDAKGARLDVLSLTLLEWQTGQRKTIVPENLGNNWGAIRWTPDDRAMLARVAAKDRKPNDFWSCSIWRLEVPSGKTSIVVPDANAGIFDITPDGKSLVYWKRMSAKDYSLVVQPMDSGAARVLLSRPRAPLIDPAVSPKGEEVAFIAEGGIQVLSLRGGEPRQVYQNDRNSSQGRLIWLDWHPGGQSILFLLRGEGGQVTLWQVPAQGGAARQITKPYRGMHYLRIHPAGKRVAFSTTAIVQHETWALEHFLPK